MASSLRLPTSQLSPYSFSNQQAASPTSIANLARIIEDTDAFEAVFKDGLQETDGDMIKQMLSESKFFFIGAKQFAFNEKDPIFFREGPIPEGQQQSKGECASCDEPFKNYKQIKYCQFCGCSVCKLCIIKTRPYPQNNEGMKNRGEICKVCDRKFFIRDMLKDSMEKIETQNQVLLMLQKQIQDMELQCQSLESDFNDHAEQAKIDLDKVRQIKKELKRKIVTLSKENQTFQEECNNLFNKKQQIEDEHKQIKETIETLREELSQADENRLKVKVKTREMELENQRLEEQIQSFMKQGRQPKNKNLSKSVINDNMLKPSKETKEQQIIIQNTTTTKEESKPQKNKKERDSFVVSTPQTDCDFMAYSSQIETLPNLSGSIHIPGGNEFYRSGSQSSSKRSSKSIMRQKMRKDPQVYCGTNSKCSIY